MTATVQAFLNNADAVGATDILIISTPSWLDTKLELLEWQRQPAMRAIPNLIVLTNVKSVLPCAEGCQIDALLSYDISSKVLQRCLELVQLGQKIFPPWSDRDSGLTEGDMPQPEPFHFGTGKGVQSVVQVVPHESSDGEDTALSQGGTRIVFSEREDQVLRRLASGLSNKTLARELCITESTVKVHIKGLLRKLQASNRTQAAIWAINNSFTVDGEPTAAIRHYCPSEGIQPAAANAGT